MKTNKLDDLFKKKLQAYEVQPSDHAVERMMGKLQQRHRYIWIQRLMVAAGLLLLGAGTIWLADVFVKTEADKIVVVGSEKIMNQPIENEVLRSEMQSFEENAVLRSGEKETASSSAIAKSTIVTDDSDLGKLPVNINRPDMENEAKVKDVKRSEEQVEGYLQERKEEQQMPVLVSEPVIASRTVPEVESSAEDMQTSIVEEDEVVPIKIVYKKTNDSQDIEPIKKNGLFKKGYKKIAAVVDRMNIKDGAKDRLRKTRDDLVAMNPVKIFSKEEN